MKKILVFVTVCLLAAITFAAQCAATTKKGTQCKRQASPGSEFCWQHGGSTKAQRASNQGASAQNRTTRNEDANDVTTASGGMCQATTKAGTQCKRKAQAGGKYCFQHAAMARDDGADAAGVANGEKRSAKAAGASQPAREGESANGLCQGKTKSGEPCKRKAKPGSQFCWQHEK